METIASAAVVFGLIFSVAPAAVQGQKNLTEKLGYEADAKLLIVHVR